MQPIPTKPYLYVLRLPERLHREEAWTEADAAATRAHFGHLQAATEAGTVVVAGRTDELFDATFGIVVFEAVDDDAARRFMAADPAVVAGVMTATLHPFSLALLRGRAEGDRGSTRPGVASAGATGEGTMDERALFTSFWIKESATTRRVLGRVPEGSTYRPDPRSRTAQEIAWQIVGEERLIIDALETGRFAWTPEPMPSSMAEILASYDAHSAGMGERWRALPDERWAGTVELSGRERSASAMAWSFLFDIVHHRGQITTYLRPMGSTVPRVYGPSADEP